MVIAMTGSPDSASAMQPKVARVSAIESVAVQKSLIYKVRLAFGQLDTTPQVNCGECKRRDE